MQSIETVKGDSRHSDNSTEKLQGILIFSLAAGFILLNLFPAKFTEFLVSFLVAVVILWILPKIRGTTLVISVALLIAGIGFMLAFETGFQQWLDSLRVNVTIAALFLLVPLLAIPVQIGGYIHALKIVLTKKMDKPSFFYVGSSILTHILGVVVSIGSVSIVHQLTMASNIKSKILVANAITRGFITTIFWSPYFSAIALVISSLHISWSSFAHYSLGLVVVSFLISYVIDRKELKDYHLQDHQDAGSEYKENQHELMDAKRKVLQLFILLFLMITIVLLVEVFTSISMVLIICFFSLIFPFAWCVLSGKRENYHQEFKRHIFIGIPQMKKEIVLFLIAGFFSGSIVNANIGYSMIQLINSVFGSFTLGIAFAITAFIVLIAGVGVHPIVPVTILVTSIDPEKIGLSAELYAVLLLASWGVSNTISPATAVNNLLANLIKVDIFQFFRWNYKYVMVMVIIIPLYLKIIGL